MKIKESISKVVSGQHLSELEAQESMQEIMNGQATDSQIAAFITALRFKGETVEEIVGCAKVMREKAIKVESKHSYLVDTCGTGGDGSNTFNISTTVAFVLAGGGVAVAKHGNRAVSSKSGSADLLEQLDVRIDLAPKDASEGLDQLGIGFLFAPLLHGAMKYAVGPRREIGIRTVFNILGPLTNPAEAHGQVLGVYSPDLTEVLAEVLNRLGTQRAFVVHGDSGLDEISLTGPTKISELKDGRVSSYYVTPQDYGFQLVSLKSIQGGNSERNAQITLEVLEGKPGPCRDIILLNSAFGFLAGNIVTTVQDGIELAKEVIDSGAGLRKLQELREFTYKVKNKSIAG